MSDGSGGAWTGLMNCARAGVALAAVRAVKAPAPIKALIPIAAILRANPIRMFVSSSRLAKLQVRM
ncbi:hypothetical protein CHELA41_20019 [Hyphomicrobiales bacterium]|nr:hypothetical protein CHELA41_20019 [Hyphomicrobiales bacterium]